jgi:hypothetical protein
MLTLKNTKPAQEYNYSYLIKNDGIYSAGYGTLYLAMGGVIFNIPHKFIDSVYSAKTGVWTEKLASKFKIEDGVVSWENKDDKKPIDECFKPFTIYEVYDVSFGGKEHKYTILTGKDKTARWMVLYSSWDRVYANSFQCSTSWNHESWWFKEIATLDYKPD